MHTPIIVLLIIICCGCLTGFIVRFFLVRGARAAMEAYHIMTFWNEAVFTIREDMLTTEPGFHAAYTYDDMFHAIYVYNSLKWRIFFGLSHIKDRALFEQLLDRYLKITKTDQEP